MGREPPDPVANDNTWVCTIYTEHYEGHVTRWTVMDHLCDKCGDVSRPVLCADHFVGTPSATRSRGSTSSTLRAPSARRVYWRCCHRRNTWRT